MDKVANTAPRLSAGIWRLAVAAMVLGVVPRSALADNSPFTIGARPAWFLLGGVTTGGTVALADRGAYLGGELSMARLRDGNYVGFYSDGYYDWGTRGTYATGGLELGRRYVGLDGGAALRFADDRRDLGVTGRFNVSIGMVGVYARYVYFGDAMANEHVLQVGVVLKLPLMIGGY
jgi:hypothetical protein